MEATKTAAKVIGSLLIGLAALAVPAHALADTEIHSSNSCEDCKNESGDAQASNSSASYTGQANGGGVNYQEGDNETEVDQDASSESGTASSGQIIGVVDEPGSDVKIFAENHNEDVKNTTGNVVANNQLLVFTGQFAVSGVNAQLGDNETDATQSTSANSGDAISGSVIGVA